MVHVVVRGDVEPHAVEYLREKIERVTALVGAPVLFARARLSRIGGPAVDRPVVADAVLDVDGEMLRAHVRGHDTQETVDLLEQRLRGRVAHRAERLKERRHRGPEGAVVAAVEAFTPPDSAVVPHTAFGMFDETAEEAAEDLEVLGYRFHLFRDLESGDDAVIERVGDDGHRVTLAGSSPVLDVADAVERLSSTTETFVFFRNAASGRGNVVYRRDDGAFGLLTPG